MGNEWFDLILEDKWGLLLGLAILKDLAPIAELTLLNGTLLDLSDILTIEKQQNEYLLLKRPTWKFPSLILMSKSKLKESVADFDNTKYCIFDTYNVYVYI